MFISATMVRDRHPRRRCEQVRAALRSWASGCKKVAENFNVLKETAMSLIITDECINCDVCEPECPNEAIRRRRDL